MDNMSESPSVKIRRYDIDWLRVILFGLLIPFLIGVLGPNIILKFIRPSWGLRYPELLFVFCLGWIGFTVPGWGLLNYLVNIMVEAHYYVSSENQWRALFFPYLPDWVVISDGAGAVTGYCQGIRDAIPIPWGAWVIPVLWWFSFFAGLLAVGLCPPSGSSSRQGERSAVLFCLFSWSGC